MTNGEVLKMMENCKKIEKYFQDSDINPEEAFYASMYFSILICKHGKWTLKEYIKMQTSVWNSIESLQAEFERNLQ